MKEVNIAELVLAGAVTVDVPVLPVMVATKVVAVAVTVLVAVGCRLTPKQEQAEL